MSYYSKILVLKEYLKGYSVSDKPVSGIVKIESDQDTYYNLKISLINLASINSGTYYLLFSDGIHFSFFDIGRSPISKSFLFNDKISAQNGFICSIVFVENESIKTVLFNSSLPNYNYEKFKEVVEYEFKKKYYKPKETTSKAESVKISENKNTYNDEIVATENYYLKDDVDISNLSIKTDDFLKQDLKEETFSAEQKNEYIDIQKTSNEEKQEIKETEMKCENSNENISYDKENISEVFEEEKDSNEDEGPIKQAFEFEYKEKNVEPYGKDRKYYLEVEEELKELFRNNKKETSLSDALPNSEWVRIDFSENKYYVVGVIKENNEPKYICYGVPSNYSKYPPKELAGFCSFMPISVFNLKGDGFWMLYQDAITGECIKFTSP